MLYRSWLPLGLSRGHFRKENLPKGGAVIRATMPPSLCVGRFSWQRPVAPRITTKTKYKKLNYTEPASAVTMQSLANDDCFNICMF